MDYVPCESSWVYPKWMILDDMIYWLWGNEVMDILIMKNVTFVGIARVFEGFAGVVYSLTEPLNFDFRIHRQKWQTAGE